MRTEAISPLRDTDFFVDQLYDFVGEIGIPMISSTYSRYVVDLNRSANPKQTLYQDGRNATSVIPLCTFDGEPIYTSKQHHPNAQQVESRIDRYYWPYHRELESLIAEMQEVYRHVLLFDAHSIRRNVPKIHQYPFSDLIVGDNDQSSCAELITEKLLNSLSQAKGFDTSYNHPFKGGYITRNYGNPAQGIHTIQLEMSQDLYMNSEELTYDTGRAGTLQQTLIPMFHELVQVMLELNDRSER
jgi:N-formylglutamate deformylase